MPAPMWIGVERAGATAKQPRTMSMSIICTDSFDDDGPSRPPENQDRTSKSRRVDLTKHWEDEPTPVGGPIPLVRLNASKTFVIPFTTDTNLAKLHYCTDPEILGHVNCNGPGCVLCRAGRSVEEKLLMPVYQPSIGAVAVLAIGPNSRPGALRPPLLAILKSGLSVMISIHKPDRATFVVQAIEVKPGMDVGTTAVAAFLARWDAGEVDLEMCYPRHSNSELASLPTVASDLKCNGISPDDVD